MSDLISRQAAIDALDKLCDTVCQYSKKQRSEMCVACPLGGAFDTIEKLPSAEPDVLDTNVGDMISKRAVLDILYLDPGIDAIREEMIKNLPSAQPERKTGRWASGNKEESFWVCSECGSKFVTPWDFCPHCGADMRGEQDGKNT